MSMEKPLTVNFEVTVPRILFPAKKPVSGGVPFSLPSNDEIHEPEIFEDVRILTRGKGGTTEYDVIDSFEQKLQHDMSFQVFHIHEVATGETLLCQVLRSDETRTNSLRVTDEVTCTLAVRQVESSGNVEENTELTASIHRVTLYTDTDGIPVTYRIDGAES